METRTNILHASLLTGEDSDALLSAVRDMAQRLLCTRGHLGQDYGDCRCCRKIFSDIHPDIGFIRRETQKDGKTLRTEIVVDQIRAVARDSVVLPNEAPAKLYVFPEADVMNASAQNALLKLLEEPPEGVFFLLCSQNPERLLPTVRSRCAIYRIDGQREEDDGVLSALARDYFLALPDALRLLRWEAKAEKLDMASMRALIPLLEEESLKSLRGRALFDFQTQLKECGEMLKVNVNSKHLAAVLATWDTALTGAD